MGYIESNLLPGEAIVQRASLHWIVFLRPAAIAAAGLAVLIAGWRIDEGGSWISIVGAVIGATGLLMAVPPWVARASSEFAVTSKRVIIKVGVLQRRTLELLIRQVEAISVDQSIAGRIFNFGTITLTGTGGVREQFHNIAHPLEFRRSIQALSTEREWAESARGMEHG